MKNKLIELEKEYPQLVQYNKVTHIITARNTESIMTSLPATVFSMAQVLIDHDHCSVKAVRKGSPDCNLFKYE